MFSAIYNTIFYQPIVNALVLIYNYASFESLGVTIIIFTFLITVILFPVYYQTGKNQRINQRLQQKLQPHVDKLKEKHKDDRMSLAKATQDLHKAHGFNPFRGFQFILMQGVVILILYSVFISSFTKGDLSERAVSMLYSFVVKPETINHFFFGADLTTSNYIIIFLSAVAQFIQGKLMLMGKPKTVGAPTQADSMAKQMLFTGPVITLLVLWSAPATLGLYWLSKSVFAIGQQVILNWHLNKYHDINKVGEKIPII